MFLSLSCWGFGGYADIAFRQLTFGMQVLCGVRMSEMVDAANVVPMLVRFSRTLLLCCYFTIKSGLDDRMLFE